VTPSSTLRHFSFYVLRSSLLVHSMPHAPGSMLYHQMTCLTRIVGNACLSEKTTSDAFVSSEFEDLAFLTPSEEFSLAVAG
jgi:hypothetical protein